MKRFLFLTLCLVTSGAVVEARDAVLQHVTDAPKETHLLEEVPASIPDSHIFSYALYFESLFSATIAPWVVSGNLSPTTFTWGYGDAGVLAQPEMQSHNLPRMITKATALAQANNYRILDLEHFPKGVAGESAFGSSESGSRAITPYWNVAGLSFKTNYNKVSLYITYGIDKTDSAYVNSLCDKSVELSDINQLSLIPTHCFRMKLNNVKQFTSYES